MYTHVEERTHISVLIRYIVCEFELVKRADFRHPLLACAGGVRVDVHALGHLWVRLARYHPARIVELVAAVIYSYHVHQQDVLGALVQARDFDFVWREHTSEKKRRIKQ